MRRASLWLSLALALFLFPFFFDSSLFLGDLYSLFVPGKIFTTTALKSGELPFWNFFLQSGTPFLADINQSLFSFSTLLFLIFPPGLALNFSLFSHLLFGALGVYALCRKLDQSHFAALTGGLTWSLSQPLVHSLTNLTLTQSLAFVPWMMAATTEYAETRSARSPWLLALFTGLSLLGGYPQIPLYQTLAGVLYLFFFRRISFRRVLFDFGWPIALTLGLLSPQLIPFLQLTTHSTRMLLSPEQVLSDSLSPTQFISWFIPNFWGSLRDGIAWGPSFGLTRVQPAGYVTLGGFFALILWAWRSGRARKLTQEDWFFLSLAGLGIFFSLGKHIPSWQWLVEQISLLRFFRIPTTFLFFWSLGSSVLVGKALEQLRLSSRLLATIALVLLFSLLLFVTQEVWVEPLWKLSGVSGFHTLPRDTMLVHHILRSWLGAAAGLLALLLCLRKRWWTSALLVIFLDLWVAAAPLLIFAPSTVYSLHSPQVEFLLPRMENARVVSLSDHVPWTGLQTYWDNVSLRPPFADSRFTYSESQSFSELIARQQNLASNWNIVAGLASPLGYNPFILRSSATYWQASKTRVNDLPALPLNAPQFTEQGVRYFLLDKSVHSTAELLAVYPHLRLAANEKDWSILEASTVGIIHSDTVRISGVLFHTNTLSFQAESTQSGKITLAITPYPGWSCRSSFSCTLTATRSGMAIDVPAGSHSIELRYSPQLWRWLLGLSVISALSIGASVAKIWYRK